MYAYMVGINVSVHVFGHGQAYVALSRVEDFHKITVLTSDDETTMRNIAFPRVFDKDYIDNQIRLRSERPILPDRMDTDYHNMPSDNQNIHLDEDMENYLDELDHQDVYNVLQKP